MPLNKEAATRYRIIDACLRNKYHRYPDMSYLIAKMEDNGLDVSVSTVQKDIKEMKESSLLGFNAPIKFSRAFKGYYYDDPDYSINIPITEDDIEAIRFAAEQLDQFRDIPVFKNYADAINKVMEAVNIRKDLAESDEEIIQFERSPGRQGSEWIPPILQAIRSRRAIQFYYTKFSSDAAKLHRLDPYLLKEYRNRWYVVGKHHERRAVNTFGLDRVSDLRITEQTFVPDDGFNAKEFFKYAFGITTFQGKPEQVVLSFDPEQAPYLKTLPLHHSQEILADTKKEFRIRLTVYPTEELKMAIRSYGDKVRVVKPKELLSSKS